MEVDMLVCSMCPFYTINENVLTNHYVRNHRSDERFYVMYNVDNCGATYKRWKSYKMHVYRKHRANVDAGLEDDGNLANHEPNHNADEEIQRYEHDADPWESAQLEAVKFVLNTRDCCKTSDVARQKVMEGTKHLMQRYMSIFLNEIQQQVDQQTRMVSLDAITNILTETIPVEELFSKVDSKTKLNDYLAEHFNMIIPQEVELGKAWVWKKKPRLNLVQVTRKGYTIPLLLGLERLLANDQVRYCVDNPRDGVDVMKTVLDGAYYKTHPFFSSNPKSLAIILYYDDIKIVNPLGSKTHKLGMFYWCLTNIYPELRSSFNAINLLAIAKYCDLKKFGINKVLDKFVQDINTLQTNGVTVTVNGAPQTFKGSLLFVTADTPAAALLGGFKQSVSASKPCRRCMTGQEEFKNMFSESEFTLRNMETHLNHVETVCSPGLQVGVRNFWQQFYGVNGKSPLLGE